MIIRKMENSFVPLEVPELAIQMFLLSEVTITIEQCFPTAGPWHQWKYSEENNIRECVEKLRPRTSK
jgi:hypothetical protein